MHEAPAEHGEQRITRRIPLWLLMALALPLLSLGVFKSAGAATADLREYACYAYGFWGGGATLAHLAPSGCGPLTGPFPAEPLRLWPREYGPLALLLFSLPALAPPAWYAAAFAAQMALVVAGITWLLVRTAAPGAAHAWLLYLLLGSMSLALTRFDLAPAALTLVALIALRAKRHPLAYAALAAATLLKFYPVLLLPLLLLETWRHEPPRRRWRGLALYALVVVLGEGVVALLHPAALLEPLRFASSRCIQVESLPATLASLWARMVGQPLTFSFAYGAMCQSAQGGTVAGVLATALGGAGALLVLWRAARGQLRVGQAAVLLLLCAMLASRVFSPQYLLWVSPLIAWEFGLAARGWLAWSTVCLLTTLVFPLSYASVLLPLLGVDAPTLVPLTALARNLLLLGLVALALWRPDWLHTAPPQPDQGGAR